MSVFENLVQVMHYRRVSYATLAKMIDMSHTGLHRAVKNETLTVATLEKICTALGVDMQELCGSHTAHPPASSVVAEPAPVYGGADKLQKLRTIQRLAAELERDLKNPGM